MKRPLIFIASALLGSLLVMTPQLTGVTSYYVSQNGAGSGDGTTYADRASLAFYNSGSGVFSSYAGADVYFCGTITGQIIPSASGTVGNIIRLRGDYGPDPGVFNHKSTGYPYQHQFVLNNKSYITLYNETTRAVIDGQMTVGYTCTDNDCLTNPYSGGSPGESIDTATTSGHALIDVSNADHITVDNWELRNGRVAIYGEDSPKYITVKRCYINHMAQNGVGLVEGPENIIIGGSEADGNEFYRVGFKAKNQWPFNPQDGQVYLAYGSGKICEDVIVTHNLFEGTDGYPFDGWGGTAIKAYSATRAMIEYNTIRDLGAMMHRGPIHLKNMQINIPVESNIIRFNNIYDGPKSGDWAYSSHPAINLTRHHKNTYVYANRVHNWESGIGLAQSEADNSECKDGIHTDGVYIWANSISDTTFYGIWLTHGVSSCTNDIGNLHLWNNSVWKTTRYYDGYPLTESVYPTAMTVALQPESLDDATWTNPVITVENSIFSEGRYGQSKSFNLGMFYDSLNGGTDYLDIAGNLWYTSDIANDFKVYFEQESFCYYTPCKYSERLTNDIPDGWLTDETIGDPLFTNTATGDLTLGASSPAINNGSQVTISIPDISFPFYSATTLTFNPNEILHPDTDWSVHPPDIVMAQNGVGGYEQGAYVYDSGASDTTDPAVNITTSSPQNIDADSLLVNFTCTDANGISTAKWRIDAAPDASNGTVVSGSSPFIATTSGYTDQGSNTLYVGCSDPSGNWGTDSITVNLDTGYTPTVGDGMIVNGSNHTIINGACRGRNGKGYTVTASCDGNCPDDTYMFWWNGDYTSDTDKACFSDCDSSKDGTTTGTISLSSSYVEFDGNNESLEWAIASEDGISDSQGTIFFSVYLVDNGGGSVSDSSMIEVWNDSNNHIWIYGYYSLGGIVGLHKGSGTQQYVYSTNAGIDAWYRCGYTWQTGASGGGQHAIICESGEDAVSGWTTPDMDQTEDLDDWASSPTTLLLGEDQTDLNLIEDAVRIKDVIVLSGYKAADPL